MANLFRRDHPPKIGLALGSGSARGWAHIGVIQALAEAGVSVDYIAGTSIGALVGAVYASGGINSLKDIVLQLDWKKILSLFDVVFPKSGLIDGRKVADFIRNHVQEKNIEDLSIPFSSVSTNLATGEEVVIQKGDVIEAVRAGISVPGIFTPVRKDGMILVDGGLVNPVPVSVARGMGADFVIAVDLNHDIIGRKSAKKASVPDPGNMTLAGEPKKRLTGNRILDATNKRIKSIDIPALTRMKQWMSRNALPNIFEVMGTSINIMGAQITATRLKSDPPDLLIQPKLGHIRFLEFHRAKEAILEGYRETRSAIDLLPG